MAATITAAVEGVLAARFATDNATLPVGSVERFSVYRVIIPGSPSNRYAVVYCPPETDRNSTFDGRSRDAFCQFQVTFAATDDDARLASSKAEFIARKGAQAIVDNPITVDGLAGPIYVQHDFSNMPRAVEVVADRPTVEVTAMFSLWADRTV